MFKRAPRIVDAQDELPTGSPARIPRTKRRRSSPLLVAAVGGLLFLGSATVEAVTTAYCQEAYINDCLNTVHCSFWNDGVYAGSIHINYRCPV